MSAGVGKEEENGPNPARAGDGKPRNLSAWGVGGGRHEGKVALVRVGHITKGYKLAGLPEVTPEEPQAVPGLFVFGAAQMMRWPHVITVRLNHRVSALRGEAHDATASEVCGSVVSNDERRCYVWQTRELVSPGSKLLTREPFRLVDWRIGGVVAIQEVQFQPPDLRLPRTQPHLIAWQDNL